MASIDRSSYINYSNAYRYPNDFTSSVENFFSGNSIINIVHPFNELKGKDTYLHEFLLPLQHSFKGLYRRDDILMVGEFEGKNWISTTGYYVGQFLNNWIGKSQVRKQIKFYGNCDYSIYLKNIIKKSA